MKMADDEGGEQGLPIPEDLEEEVVEEVDNRDHFRRGLLTLNSVKAEVENVRLGAFIQKAVDKSFRRVNVDLHDVSDKRLSTILEEYYDTIKGGESQ